MTTLLADITPSDVYVRQTYTFYYMTVLLLMMIVKLCLHIYDIRSNRRLRLEVQDSIRRQDALNARQDRLITRQEEINEAVLDVSKASHTLAASSAKEVVHSSEVIETTGREIKKDIPVVAETAAESMFRKMADGNGPQPPK